MKLLGFWFLPSFLWALETPQLETRPSDQDLCQEDEPTLHRYNNLTRQMELVEEEDGDDKVSCLLYPDKTLRCTMLGQYLPRGSQLSASVIISDLEEKTSTLPECSSEPIQPSGEPGKAELVVVCRVDPHFRYLTVLLDVSGRGTYDLHCHKFSFEVLEVLSPPLNITAVVREGLLLVTWALPYSFSSKGPACFHYQLNDSHQVYEIERKNSLKMPVDPAARYEVRMRTRKDPNCLGPEEWSAWSEPIALAAGLPYNLNYVVIVSIVLGTPMIILALLLLLKRPRVSEILFPQIPQLPKKYKDLLKRPASCSFLPVVQTAYEEHITVVEDTQSSNDELKHDL